MGIFFKVLARNHAVSMFFGSLLREPIDQVVALSQGDNRQFFLSCFFQQQTKLRVVALSHGDNPQLFLFAFLLVKRMSCGSSPWGTATTLNFFYPTFLLGTRMSCGSSPWGTATTLNFFYPPFFWGQGWAAGRRLEAGRRPSTFFYLEKVCSLAGIWTPDVLTTVRGSYH